MIVDWQSYNPVNKASWAIRARGLRLFTSILALYLSLSHSLAVASPDDVVNLITKQSGVHEITMQDLVAKGVDIRGMSSSELMLMNQGKEVPMQVLSGELITDETVLRFVAEELDTLYTDTNVYTLKLGIATQSIQPLAPAFNSRVPWAVSYLETVTYEPQNSYSFTSPDVSDPWYAKRMVALGDQASVERIELPMPDIALGGNSGRAGATMKVNVWGASDLPGSQPDHHVKVAFNNVNLIDEKFDGLVSRTYQVGLENLVENKNSVTVTLPGQSAMAFDAVNLNSVEVSYPRKFIARSNALSFESSQEKFRIRGFEPDGTDAQGQPTLDLIALRHDRSGVYELTNTQTRCRSSCTVSLSGGSGLASYHVVSRSSVLKPTVALLPNEEDIASGQAKYLIISHPDFIGESGDGLLEAYAAELQSEMGSVDIVNVESIYAQFGDHIFNPVAIKDYIKFSKAQRGTEFVLLVGGDVYDYKRFENEDATSFIPSLYAATGNNINFAPVDAKYVDVNDDNVPDLSIGRLPVRTTAHLSALMTKRRDYLNRDYTGTALMIADGYDDAQQYDFRDDAEEVRADFLSGFTTQQAYVDDLGVRNAREKVKNEIGKGTSLTAFFGHSSTNQWSFDGLFTGPDAANLDNQGKPTVVAQWGCWNAYYVSPNEDSMGHRFLMEGDRGAVTVMGASTLTNADSERRLARLVFDNLAKGQRLGTAVTNAKQEYAQDYPYDVDVLLGWTVLGLPELYVN